MAASQNSTTSSTLQAHGGIPERELYDLFNELVGGPPAATATFGGPSGCKTIGISDLVSEIKSLQLRKNITRSIIKCRDAETALQVARELRCSITGNRHWTTSGFIAFVPHLSERPHVHIWHDCNPIQSMCRCRIIAQFRKKDGDAFLATRESIRNFRPLRGISTEEEKKDGGTYYGNLLK
nr:MAG: hypothetical protein [Bee densovirus 8]